MVKFMVNVRLVLNNVNNHVGSVYVEKLIAQNDILCSRYAELYTSDTDSQKMLCCVESGEDSDVARSGGAAVVASRREDVKDEEAISAMLNGFAASCGNLRGRSDELEGSVVSWMKLRLC